LFHLKTITMSTNESPFYTTISVSGMSCNHCKMNVEKTLSDVDGIEEVTVDLEQGTVMIGSHNLNLDEVSARVNELGFKYIGTV
jgi:copper chaperone CopZ